MREPAPDPVPWWRAPGVLDRLLLVTAAGVVLVGVVLRFVADSPMWLDEALTVNIAAEPFGEIADRLRHDGHPPLYYWLLHAWMAVFGEGDLAARSLSSVFAVAALPVGYVLGRRRAGTPGAVGALVLLAASPFSVRYASEARQYAMVAFLALLGWLLVDRARERPTVARLAPVTLVAGALLLTHYWAAFLLGGLGVPLLVSAWRHRGTEAGRTDLRVAVAVAAGGVLFLPWVPTAAYQLEHTGTPWAEVARPTAALASAVSTLGSGAPEGFLLVVVVAVLVVVGVLGRRRGGELVLAGPDDPAASLPALVVVLGIALAAVVSFVTGSAFENRYFAVYVPIVLVLAGLGLAVLPARTRLAVLVLVGALFTMAVVDDLRRDRTQADEVAAVLAAEAGADDVLLVCPDQLAPAHERLLGAAVPILPYPDLDGDPRFVEWVDYLDRFEAVEPGAVVADLVASRPAGSRIWLAWESHYRVVGDECAVVAEALGRLTGSGTVRFTSDPPGAFETVNLHEYRVPG